MALRSSAAARGQGRKTSGKTIPPERTDSALYLYGITRSTAGASARALRATREERKKAARRGIEKAPLLAEGIDGASPVTPLACAGFTCWISRVSRNEFAGSLAQRMEDLDWLARAGARHQHVVAALATRGDVLPARFGTVFLSAASLAQHVTSRQAALSAAFRHVAGADEWGVKIFRLPQVPSPPPKGESGASYLRRKSAAARAVAHPRALPPEVARFAAALARLARAAAPGGAVTQGRPLLVWHRSLLMPRSRRAALARRVRQFARDRDHARRYRIEITGPWPPYSFVKHAH